MNRKGRITIPTDADFVDGTREIAEKWGADAVRDCDGTVLPLNAAELADKVYNTYFVIRGDKDWGESHPEEWQHLYLMSPFTESTGGPLEIEIMKGYYPEQVAPDYDADPKKYWEVIDRTTGQLVTDWTLDRGRGIVSVNGAQPFHEYTLSFLAFSLWDPVHMYNYKTNNWDTYKHRMYDPFYEKTGKYIFSHLEKWCKDNPQTNVVRFTTFLYQFSLVFNEKGKEKNVNWFGYTMAVSPKMLDAFEKEYGYKMRAEYLINAGEYDSGFRVPEKQYLDYMDFVGRYVTDTVKKLADTVHKAGKEAMMFLGDCWIGAEPYGKYFSRIGLDAVVGSVGSGVTVRMLSDMPGVKYCEGRFLPYFFPDTFYEGNDPVPELERNWLGARRAMLRNPVDRIGFGGYLKLAAKFPRFIDRAAEICDEFRELYDNVKNKRPKNFLRVGVLNAWGKVRSWMCHMVAHELWYQQTYSYLGILECLSGLPVDIQFVSFEDILAGKGKELDVIINAGDAGTAWSGGRYWQREDVVSAVKSFIAGGGGFVGVGEPTAADRSGRCFALASALGVDKERGFTLSEDKYNLQKAEKHFITEDIVGEIDFGEGMKGIYALEGATVLDIKFSSRFTRNVNTGEVLMAVNNYGKGRCVYLAGLPYSFENSRLLYRALLWSAGKEGEIKKAFSENVLTDCGYYEDGKKYAVINNSSEAQQTVFYDISGQPTPLKLKGGEIKWIQEK